ncbi:hypothetical protein [Frigoribacterium sp. RIT-PI-h]|uniref:hypothetical protein n=1 Tax=Frigoribacterium sp. RIT-PI-h TaxID=1690245 RepID=UPI0006B9F5D9|nr:hypothetical protein [Frigoribacterium sp. RIT-PI-h]KPG78084.1 hypothetical protein AEQ27_14845 [Frigoribacterium sp. RIT-PI-h]
MSTTRIPLPSVSRTAVAAPRSARVSRVPAEPAPRPSAASPAPRGRKVAALPAGGMILLLVVGLLPAVATLVGG